MTIICLYTNPNDPSSLKKFKSSFICEKLKKNSKFKIIEVIGGNFTKTSFANGKLRLAHDESYSSLSVKTFKMIDYLVKNVNFTKIIKLDPNIIDYSKKDNIFMGADCLDFFYNSKRIESAIFNDDNRDYFGIHLINHISKKNYESWAFTKQLKNINFDTEFKGESCPPFYTGKLYGVSHDFSTFISSNGKHIAMNHKKNLGGSEDTMVGRLFAKYIKKINWTYEQPWIGDLKESFKFVHNI